jgi:hypothetical protein
MLNAYGLAVDLELALPELDGVRMPAPPNVPRLRVVLAPSGELEQLWGGGCVPEVHASATVDDGPWVVEQGRRGDLRMSHPLAQLHLDAERAILRCAPTNADDPAWRRLLLDTGLVTVSLARGFDALHASAVTLGGSAVAFAGRAGAGKTTLMATLLSRGALLLADDVVALARTSERGVLAHPGPPLVNLPQATPADAIGEVLAQFGEEQWVRADNHAVAPAELYLVVILERTDGIGEPVLRSVRQPAVALLAHALHSGSAPQRRSARFQLLADVAETAHVMSLTAGREVPPAALADLVQARIPTAGIS